MGCMLTVGHAAAQTGDGENLYWDLPEPANPPKNMQEVKALLDKYPTYFQETKIGHDTLSFYFTQYLDHNTQDGRYTMFNRCYITKYIAADRVTVLHTSGYAVKPAYTDYYDLAKALEANMIQVEHRYAGESKPSDFCFEKKGGILNRENYWNYNTAYQQSTDLAYVVNTLKRLKVFTGQMIATGVSKCGMTSTFLAMHYPKTCDVYVPFCAPFNETMREPLGSYVVNDYGKKLAQYSKQDSIVWDRSWVPVRDYLQNAELKKACNKKLIEKYEKLNYDVSGMTDDDCTVDILKKFYTSQWDKACYYHPNDWKNMMPSHKGPSDSFDEAYCDSMFLYLIAVSDSIRKNVNRLYDSSRHLTRASSVTDDEIYNAGHYEVQTMYELGNISVDFSKVSDLVSKEMLARLIKDSSDELVEPCLTIGGYFGLDLNANPVKPVHPIAPEVRKYVKKAQVPILFVYGEFDPWTLSGITDEDIAGNPNVSRYVVPSGVHDNNLLDTTFSSDPQAGPWIVEKVKGLLSQATAVGAIRELPVAEGDDAIYDLTGRRVTTPVRHGLYIKKGKKIIF